MLATLFRARGMSEREIHERLWGHRKHEEVPGLGRSARALCISLGTGWGRNLVLPDLWVDTTVMRTARLLRQRTVVVDDVRLPNELWTLKRLGGVMVGIVRPGAVVTEDAAPCEGLIEIEAMDAVVENTGPIEDLELRLLHTLERLEENRR